MDDKNSYASYSSESFTLDEIVKLEKNSHPTAAFKEDKDMFGSELRELFGL